MPIDKKTLTTRLAAIKVLVVDDEPYTRKVVRALLANIGVHDVYDAPDGSAGLEMIRTVVPDVIILDWEMPGLDGPKFARMVRLPEAFPNPDVPIIMLTGHGERSRMIQAMNFGVDEFLLKPVSSRALQDRLISVLVKSHELVQGGEAAGQARRKMATSRADGDAAIANLTLLN